MDERPLIPRQISRIYTDEDSGMRLEAGHIQALLSVIIREIRSQNIFFLDLSSTRNEDFRRNPGSEK